MTTSTGTWAVGDGRFGGQPQQFLAAVRPPRRNQQLALATPPGVASNGGLLLTSLSAGSVLAGFRPSHDPAYSPLAAISMNNGKDWSPSLLMPALADIPGALAADTASGRLLALLTDGTTDISNSGGTSWTPLVTRRALAASPAGTRCRLDSLTAAAFTSSGHPLLGARCSRPGTAGIFSQTGRTWRLTGPAIPAAYAHQAITVLRLTTTGDTATALLGAGTGPAERLLAGWSADGGAHWTLSPPLPLNGATLTSASSGPASSLAITLTHRRAAVITRSTDSWRQLPVLPPNTATLAPSTTGGWNALAVHGTQLTIWQAATGAQAWASAQVIKVPVQFGSSG